MLKLKTNLQNTLAMYDQACEDLVQAKKKVLSFIIPQVLPELDSKLLISRGV